MTPGARRQQIGRQALIVLVALVVIVLGAVILASQPGPQPSPSPAPTRTTAARPSPSIYPTPDDARPVLASWQLSLPLFEERTIRLEIADQSGHLGNAKPAETYPEGSGPEDPFALDIRPVPDRPNALFVGWVVLVCEYRGRLLIDESATHLFLTFAPSPGCDLAPIAQRVVLEFDRDIDPRTVSGRKIGKVLFDVGGFTPSAIGFADQQIGWMGGTTPDLDAAVIHTHNGGSVWRVSGLGEGRVTEVASIDQTHAFATRECPETPSNCLIDTFDWDDDFGGWSGKTLERLVRMDFAGPNGIAVALPEEGAAPELWLTDDLNTWEPIRDPCPAESSLADAERLSATDLLVLCLAEGGTGSTVKWLLASDDRGGAWRERSSSESGGLRLMGTPTGFELAADSSGWMWGSRMPLLHTTDGGRTWSGLDLADGDVRIVIDASYLGGGAGYVLLQDPDRQRALLLWTDDDQAWQEISAWPLG